MGATKMKKLMMAWSLSRWRIMVLGVATVALGLCRNFVLPATN
jgi:hypothetical protein